MARTPLAPLTFGVVYFTKCRAPISVDVIEARDYWAACRFAWKQISKRRKRSAVADFMLIEDQIAIANGPQHIRAAAVEILNARDVDRQAAIFR